MEGLRSVGRPPSEKRRSITSSSNCCHRALAIPGSVANLIVVQRARAHGVAIGFWRYFAVGAPLTVLTILVGLAPL